MNTPFFSICMPCYNGTKTVRRAIESVLRQVFEDWRLTIVDDRSTDGTWELLTREYGSHPRIRLLRNEQNLGLRGNLSRCLQLAEGRWLGILAQDDEYRLHALETAHGQLQNRQDVVLWMHGQLIRDGDRPPIALPVYRTATEFSGRDLARLLYLRGNRFGVLSSYFISLSAVREAGVTFLDGEMLVDERFYLRLLMSHPDRRAIYWPDLLTCANVDDTTLSHQLGSSGRASADLLAEMGDLAGLGWQKSTLLYQLARLVHCAIKFRRPLRRADARTVPLRSARALVREILRPSSPPR